MKRDTNGRKEPSGDFARVVVTVLVVVLLVLLAALGVVELGWLPHGG